jgi:hypothetical protein
MCIFFCGLKNIEIFIMLFGMFGLRHIFWWKAWLAMQC